MRFKPIWLVLGLAVLILTIWINKPFYGYHDWNGVTYGQIARNYVRYGIFTTKLGQVENFSPTPAENFTYDTHYPPLFTLFLSLPVAIFGGSEWTIRLLPVLLSLANLYLIYLLGRKLKDGKTGLLAAVFALFTPVFIYFGKNPIHEVLTFFFILLNTYLFLIRSRWLFLTAILSLFSGWPAYYILPLFGLFGLVQTKQKQFLLFFLLPFLGLSLHLLHVRLLTGSFSGGGLLSILLVRLNLVPPPTDIFTWSQFFSRMTLYARNMFTLPLLLAAALGFIFRPQYRLPLLFLATGFLHPYIFSNAGYLHDYLQLPGLGFIALSTALLFSRLPLKLGFLLALLFLLTKLPFTVAMVNSNMSQPEYDLAQHFLRGQTPNLTFNQASMLRHGVVAPYYLQREIEVELVEGIDQYQATLEQDKLVVKPWPSKSN